jgi:large subunit ribosomal protein L5
MKKNNFSSKGGSAFSGKTQLEKVVVNAGIGKLSQSAGFSDKILPELEAEFASFTGQKPVLKTAKKSIAGFKIRAGNVVGIMVTLRVARMIGFINKLVNIALPRVRDFRGIPLKNVDKNGNLTIGIKEHIIFPEVSAEVSKLNFGLQATIVPKVRGREEALEVYKLIGIPFSK